MQVKKTVVKLICALFLLSSPLVYAAAITGNLTVTASVVGSCTAAAGTLPFGAYSGSQVVTQGNMTLTCTGNTLVNNIALNDGNSVSGSTRRMTGTANPNPLNYNIYKADAPVPNISTSVSGTCAATPTTVWGGTGTLGTSLGFAPASTGRFPAGTTSTTISVCGIIPAGQAPIPDIYQDTVQITVNFT
jgi:spore coat protein U-like protein